MSNTAPAYSKLLANWTYTPSEWNSYVKITKKLKLEDHIYFGFGILILCTPGLMWIKGTSFFTAILFSAPLALLIPWLRFRFGSPHLKSTKTASYIKIHTNFLNINGQKIPLEGPKKWVKNIKIIEHKEWFLLEFDIAWNTHKGTTNDETRIPIPPSKLQKALELIDTFKNRV